MKNTRETAFQVIYKVLEENEHSHVVLRQALNQEKEVEKRDRAFVTRLVEGTLERLLTIDYILNQVSKTPVKKMKPVVRTVLRMSVYQLMYMDSVPDSAVCNEAVKLVKGKGLQGLSGFTNGVLRNVARNREQWNSDGAYPDKKKTPVKYLSIRYSLPEWLCSYFVKEYGFEKAEQIAEGSLRNPQTTIRCNTTKISKQDLRERLKKQGISAENGVYAEDALDISGYDALDKIPEFKEGYFQVQDESSMLVAQLAGLKKDDLVVDVCSAPGGKAIHAANLLESLGGGTVISRDVSEKKTALINENTERLQVKNITVQIADATILDETLTEQADVVIADLPCSGIGIMAKKPEIRYRMTKENQIELVKLQKEILNVVHRYVKPGGILMYSTCTINKEENEEQVKEICEKYGFIPAMHEVTVPTALKADVQEGAFIQLLPGIHACDGFFIARLKKKN
ncbi:MAG: 16S rRNA (cytosine(967)-C(5))-methyltransferase RsmB [Lachnospiraceae bacterium]|nr:16S rRNA (cytosine(967)-C(5))-methyltransferase RsmB [Lachnospiraceae bacterium]MBP3567873.1 16S rRNA (cytosine(967)-C(5))-methyltransferase RsmB [Lachnospiraceae bacterium]